MKRKFGLLITLAVVILAFVCCFASCSERDDGPGDVTPPENVVTRTVEIICGNDRVVKVYEDGTEITLNADIEANQVFVCWLADNEPVSYDREAKYTITKDVVIRAIYASLDEVSLDACGGVLPEGVGITVTAYGVPIEGTDGSLISGYGYILPVPVKERHKFVGWKSNAGELTDANRVTDASGTSVKPYDGSNVTFYAEYSENPYVTLVTKNSETDAIIETRKAYIEDEAVILRAPSVIDRECIGWKDDGTGTVLTDEEEYRLALGNLSAGTTYTYVAIYREAYRLSIIGGLGGGAYARDDEVELVGVVPAGNDFVGWNVTVGDKVLSLGRIELAESSAICLIDKDENKVTYYSPSEGAAVTVNLVYNGAEMTTADGKPVTAAQAEEKFLMGEIELVGLKITEGSVVRMKAVYKRKDYTLLYLIDCMIDGQYCLADSPAGEQALIDAEFEKVIDGTGVFTGVFKKERYYNYNEALTMSSVPSIPHYKFGNWENADLSSRIPSTMPGYDVTVKGTFIPDTHQISISCNTSQGSVKIGAGSGTLSGYYPYGSTITITLVANSGYKLNQFLDIDSANALDRVELATQDTQEDIVYVYKYKVTQNETFTIKFTERDYLITYIMKVMYDGKDVTENQEFFKSGQYSDGWYVTTESRNYGVRAGLKDKVTVGGTNLGDPALIYEPSNWTVSDWVADKDTLGDINDFTMPKENVTVRSVCTINNYRVSFSKQAGVGEYEIQSINGKDANIYETDEAYRVPFGSKFVLGVSVEEGYSVGDIGTMGVPVLGAESDYVSADVSRYEARMSFSMTFGSGNTIYLITAKQNMHTVTYYLNVNYEHEDRDRLLSDYITFDKTQSKEINGKTYYLVGTINNQTTDYGTVENKNYGDRIPEPTIDASEQRYTFGGWTRMQGESVYYGSTMPDSDIWEYASLTLNEYKVTVVTDRFNFDNDDGQVNSANVKTVYDTSGDVSTYDDGEFTAGFLHYYSEIILKRHDPTGYTFYEWQITTGGLAVTLEIPEDAEYNTVYTVISMAEMKYQYKLIDADTIAVYLTENSDIAATFRIKTFKAISVDQSTPLIIKSSSAESDRYAKVFTFEYASTLDIAYSYNTLFNTGMHLTEFIVSTSEDMSEVTETMGTEFNEDTLSYETAGTVNKTTENQYTTDVYIYAATAPIKYKIFYTIYPAALSIDGQSGAAPVTVQKDLNGDPYEMYYNETIELIGDDVTKALAEANGLDASHTMYSCWYTDPSNSVHAVLNGDEAGAMPEDAETVEYKHVTPRSHAYFSCYLVDIFSVWNGKAQLNPVIRNNIPYINHFGRKYNEIDIPSVGRGDGIIVNYIEAEGFVDLHELRKITFPSSVKYIEEGAFKGCVNLQETGINENILWVGDEAYRGCSSITEITIEENVYKIGQNAFADIPRLKQINYLAKSNPFLLENKLQVGETPFNCSGTAATDGIKVFIGAGATMIARNMFTAEDDNGSTILNGTNITVLEFESGGTEELSIAGEAFAKTAINQFILPSRVNDIGDKAFEHCKNLTFADMGASEVRLIGKQTFRYCALTEVILPKALEKISDYAFIGCQDLVSVYYANHNGIREIGIKAFGTGDSQNDEETKLKRVTDIAQRDEADGGEEVVRLINVEVIGQNAFFQCTNIKEVYLGGSNKAELDKTILSGAKSLNKVVYDLRMAFDKENMSEATAEDVTFGMTYSPVCELIIGPNVEHIPAYMFSRFASVLEVTVPATVKSIGAEAFSYMSGLLNVNFNLDGNNFEYKSQIGVIPRPFFMSGNPAQNKGMTVTFGENVENIKSGLFREATYLKAATIPASEKGLTVGSEAFRNTKITTFDIPVRDGNIMVESNILQGSPLQTFTLAPNDYVVFKGGALSTGSRRTAIRLSIMGRELNSLWAVLGTGENDAFTIQKEGVKLIGTLEGKMSTVTGNKDFTVERTDELRLTSGSKLYIEQSSKGTVHGKLSVGGGNIYLMGQAVFRGITYDKDDFDDKNSISAFTHLRISEESEDVVFDTLLNVAANMEIGAGPKIDITEGANFERFLTVEEDAIVNLQKDVKVNGGFLGTVSALPAAAFIVGSTVIVSSHSPEYHGGYIMTNLSVVSGKTNISMDERQYKTIELAEGELEVVAEREYFQGENDLLILQGDTTFTVSGFAMIYNYLSLNATEIDVQSNGVLRYRRDGLGSSIGYTVIADVFVTGRYVWTEDEVKKSLPNIYSYYGSLANAFADTGRETENTYEYTDMYLKRNITFTDTMQKTSEYKVSLDFVTYSITLESSSLDVVNDIELRNANLTSDAKAIINESNIGKVVLTSGKITAEEDAIYAYDGITVAQGAEVESRTGFGVQSGDGAIVIGGTVKAKTYAVRGKGDITVGTTGSVTAEEYGIYRVGDGFVTKFERQTIDIRGTVTCTGEDGVAVYMDRGLDDLIVGGTVSGNAASGSGIKIVGTETNVRALSTARISAYYGVYVKYNREDETVATVRFEDGSVVSGGFFGIMAVGSGRTQLYGTVSATSARATVKGESDFPEEATEPGQPHEGEMPDHNDKIFSGAVVIFSYDKVKRNTANIEGSLINTAGDAFLYVRHDFNADGFEPDQVNDNVFMDATVTGKIVQLAVALKEGFGDIPFLYRGILNGRPNLDPISEPEREDGVLMVNYIGENYIQMLYKCMVFDESFNKAGKIEDVPDNEKFVLYYDIKTDFADAVGKGFVVMLGGTVDFNIPSSDVWVALGNVRLRNITVNGSFSATGENAFTTIEGNVNVSSSGKLNFFNPREEEEDPVYSALIKGILTVQSGGYFKINNKTVVENGGRLDITMAPASNPTGQEGTGENGGGESSSSASAGSAEGAVEGPTVDIGDGLLVIQGSMFADVNRSNRYSFERGVIELDGGSLTSTKAKQEVFILGTLRLKEGATLASDATACTNVEILDVSEGSYEFDYSMHTEKIIMGRGAHITFKSLSSLGDKQEVNGEYVYRGDIDAQYPDSSITIDGTGTKYYETNLIVLGSSPVFCEIIINYLTEMNGTSPTIKIGGNLKVNAETKVFIPDPKCPSDKVYVPGLEIKKAIHVVSENSINGRMIVDGDVKTSNGIDVERDCGLEYNSGSINGEVKIYVGSWVYKKNGTGTLTKNYVVDTVGIHCNSEVYNKNGINIGMVYSSCENHVMTTVEPTCGTYGYVGCFFEISEVLSDGTPFDVKHGRENIIEPTGNHRYAQTSTDFDSTSGKHICLDCGEEAPHEYTQIAQLNTYEHHSEAFLGYRCKGCGDVHEMMVFEPTVTEKAFNDMGLKFKDVRFEGVYYPIMLNNNRTGVTLGDIAEGGATLNGTLYYIVPINSYFSSSGAYYITVRHDADATHGVTHCYRYSGGRMTCIACGAEQDASEAHNHELKLTIGTFTYGGVTYKRLERRCDYCDVGAEVVTVNFTPSNGTGSTNVTSLTNAIKAAGGSPYTVSVTGTLNVSLASNALFSYKEDGVTYYAFQVTVKENNVELTDGTYVVPVVINAPSANTTLYVTTVTGESNQNIICTDNSYSNPWLLSGLLTAKDLNDYISKTVFSVTRKTSSSTMGGTTTGYKMSYGYSTSNAYTPISAIFTTTETINGKLYNKCGITIKRNSTTTTVYVYVEHVCVFETELSGDKRYFDHVCKYCDNNAWNYYNNFLGDDERTIGVLNDIISNKVVFYNNKYYTFEGLTYGRDSKASDVREGFLTIGGVCYDIFNVRGTSTKGASDGVANFYLVAKHTVHEVTGLGNAHICKGCGTTTGSGPHSEDIFDINDDGYVIKKCATCGIGSIYACDVNSISALNGILQGITFVTKGINANTDAVGNAAFHLTVCETDGDLHTLYQKDIGVEKTTLSSTAAYYTEVYVKLAATGWIHPGVYKVLVPHVCNTWKPNTNNTGHVCAVCGKVKASGDAAHKYNHYVVAPYTVGAYNGTTYEVNMIRGCCAVCGGLDDPWVIKRAKGSSVSSSLSTIEVAILQENGLGNYSFKGKYKVSFVEDVNISTKPNDGNHPTVTVGEDNDVYYLWEVKLTNQLSPGDIITGVYIGWKYGTVDLEEPDPDPNTGE